MTDQSGRHKPRLAFISPLFLFPNDAGGKIRTTNILRGLKGGAFDITLVSVASTEQQARYALEIDSVCDEFIAWRPGKVRPKWLRALDLFGQLPVNVVVDRTPAGMAAVNGVASRPDVDLMVFDFVHSAVLRPHALRCRSICFTHNVEAEIFARHATQAKDPVRRWLWAAQHAKMHRYEHDVLRAFDAVIAVSERDATFFTQSYGVKQAKAIPTGVDLDFFAWAAPPMVGPATPPTVVFTGSMNWAANIDGVQFFLTQVWPRILSARADARFVVVGRDAPAHLVALGGNFPNVRFTGFVDDVRPYVHAAHAFVIPLFVGGGTRIKAFEAMAMGCPVISTSIGIEGLDADPDVHYLARDDAQSMASAVLALFGDEQMRLDLSERARELVETRFGHALAAKAFEEICLDTLSSS